MKANNVFFVFNIADFILQKKNPVLFVAKSRLSSLKPIYVPLPDFPPLASDPAIIIDQGVLFLNFYFVF